MLIFLLFVLVFVLAIVAFVLSRIFDVLVEVKEFHHKYLKKIAEYHETLRNHVANANLRDEERSSPLTLLSYEDQQELISYAVSHRKPDTTGEIDLTGEKRRLEITSVAMKMNELPKLKQFSFSVVHHLVEYAIESDEHLVSRLPGWLKSGL